MNSFFTFDFFSNLKDQLKGLFGENFKEPTMSIKDIDMTGLVTIKFSDRFIVPSDISVVKENFTDEEDIQRSSLELEVEAVDDQTEESLKFTWSVVSFTET